MEERLWVLPSEIDLPREESARGVEGDLPSSMNAWLASYGGSTAATTTSDN